MKANFIRYTGLLLLVFLLITTGLYSQSWVYFSGMVVNDENELPVATYPVFISLNDSVNTFMTLTNQDGVYQDSLFIYPGEVDYALVTVFDCFNSPNTEYFDELNTLNTADFNICIEDSGVCLAFFQSYIDPINQNYFYFFNLSQGDFTSYHWDFGDGTSSNDFDPMHLFNSPGIYNVCLTIEDSLSDCYDIYCSPIVVGEPDCNANFTWQPDQDNPSTIYFTDLSDGNIMMWNWDFGDMTFSEEQSPTHQYSSAGQYIVTLTIMDSMQICYDVVSQWVDIWDSTYCTAAFKADMDTLNNIPYVYQFNDESSGNPENWLWDFGDGQVSFEQNPIHVYEQPGSYEVCLTISSNNGSNECFDTKCQNITTPEYYDFGGQVFIGDYPLNIEEDDSSNMAIAYLYRRYINQWELMDAREFWKFGYYWFTDKPEGEYIIRTDLLLGSVDYGNYAPVYHNNTSSWNEADIFILDSEEEFAINVSLKPLTQYQTGVGSISGYVEPGLDCEMSMPLEGELVYLLNDNHQMISFTYTNEFGVFTFDGLGLTSYFVKAEITGKSSPRVNVQLTENNPSSSNVFLDVECNSYVGMDEYQTISNFTINNVYPQPASDRFSIDLNTLEESTCQFEIISIDGKTMWTKNMNTRSGNSVIEINVSLFKSGLYFLKVSDLEGNGIKTRKIIIN